jgi:hypothetical protein
MAGKGYCSAVIQYTQGLTLPPRTAPDCYGDTECELGEWYWQGRNEAELRAAADEMKTEINALNNVNTCDCSNLITSGFSQGASIALLQQESVFQGPNVNVKGTLLLSGNPMGSDTQVTYSSITPNTPNIDTINIITKGDRTYLHDNKYNTFNTDDFYENTATFLAHPPSSDPGPPIANVQMFDKPVPVQQMITDNRKSIILQQGSRHNWARTETWTSIGVDYETNTRQNIGNAAQCVDHSDCLEDIRCVDPYGLDHVPAPNPNGNGSLTKGRCAGNVCARYVVDHYLNELDSLISAPSP